MLRPFRSRYRHACLAIGVVITLAFPVTAAAHAELTSSVPADGATVPAPFEGPVVLTFSEALGGGSTADLAGPDGTTVASATVDGPGMTMTITLAAALDPGDYEVQWTTVADDGHVERGTITFTVAPPVSTPTAAPTPEPTSAPAASATASARATAETSTPPSVELSASPGPSPAGGSDASSSASESIFPIVAALIALAAGAAYLLRRRRPPTP